MRKYLKMILPKLQCEKALSSTMFQECMKDYKLLMTKH